MPSKPNFNTALITGSYSGLGKELADFLESKGIEVLRTGSQFVDLTSPEHRKKLLELISKKKPDLIINNAGIGLYGPCLAHAIEDQLAILRLNCEALVEITLHSAKTLKDAGMKGTILNISSAAAFFVFPTFALYAASKSFVNQFSLALHEELKEVHIDVLCACPGPISTGFRSRAAKGHPQKQDGFSMTCEKAVQALWKQLQRKKPLMIFAARTRIRIFIARLFPQKILGWILKKGIQNRYRN